MNQIPEQTVFTPDEKSRLETNVYLRPYLDITKAQLVGLLSALGEYAIRVGPPELFRPGLLGAASSDPHALSAHRDLLTFVWKRTATPASATDAQCVFDTEERGLVRRLKYVHDAANITKEELAGLLESVERYSARAADLKQVFGPAVGLVRLIHGHNAVLAFRDRRFTHEEFGASVRAVLNGEESQLTTRGTRRT